MTTVYTAEVPTEDGRICVIEFEQELDDDWWTVHISSELISEAPQGLTAALGVAILQMKAMIENETRMP